MSSTEPENTASPRFLDRPVVAKARRYFPVVAFVCGFLWDAITLGNQIKPSDLFILLGYLAGAAAILTMIGRGVTFRGSQYLNTVLQFFFGGIFSALFIFYFLSSSDLPGYLFVIGLAALLIGNEFLESAYSELTLSWAFFTLSAIMFFNFALAHLFHSVSTFWFYLGTLIAALLVVGLRQLSRHDSASIKPSIVLALLVLVLHFFNVIPPVPLVKKEILVAHDLRKEGNHYVGAIESPGWRFWRSSAPVFHRKAGERVYCFTSVFAPNGIETTIRHRWQRYDANREEWLEAGTVPVHIAGGRRGGYRALSYKSNATPGLWRVIAEAESGAAIGIVLFEVEIGDRARPKSVKL
ncbi:MAG TPA: DUF2914 domain-containing protein [Thermoanaerobaculia bacterium]